MIPKAQNTPQSILIQAEKGGKVMSFLLLNLK